MVSYLLLIKKGQNSNSVHKSVSNNLIAKSIEEIIDGMVLELYFQEEMREKNVTIFELVIEALAKTNTGNIEEKIYNFYSLVSHADSEIRNRILNFPIASPTVLKPILQG